MVLLFFQFFQRYDVNHDNFLDFNETLNGVDNKFNNHNGNTSSIFNRPGVNLKERRIKKHIIERHFETMDYNQDKSISLSEFNKMHLIYVNM